MKKPTKIVIDQNPEAPIEKKVLAQAVVEISRSMKALTKSGLNFTAVTVLVQHQCDSVGSRFNKSKPSLSTVREILGALSELEKAYTR